MGKLVGSGLVHNNNECCSDSLLRCSDSLFQTLARHGFISSHLEHDANARKQMCQAIRIHLVNHTDSELQPRMRTSTGAIADASDREHDSAFLQHDVHAEEIVNQIFTIFDRDANGHLDFVEFLTATDMTTNGSPEEKLRNI